MADWTDQFIGDRMAVDQEFSDRIQSSSFTTQEWGTIMTAVEFVIESPEDPESATLVARTDDIEHVLPALEDMQGPMGPAGPESSGQSGSGGIVSRILGSLGIGEEKEEKIDEEQLQTAKQLADEYASAFEDHLKEQEKWEQACSVAAEE